MEVDQEGAYCVLVRLRNPLPQLVLPFHDLVPLSLGLLAAARAQPVSQQLSYSLTLQAPHHNGLRSQGETQIQHVFTRTSTCDSMTEEQSGLGTQRKHQNG